MGSNVATDTNDKADNNEDDDGNNWVCWLLLSVGRGSIVVIHVLIVVVWLTYHKWWEQDNTWGWHNHNSRE